MSRRDYGLGLWVGGLKVLGAFRHRSEDVLRRLKPSASQ